MTAILIAANWTWEPGILLPIFVSAALYTFGARNARTRRRPLSATGSVGNRSHGWHALSFATGLLVLAVALLSPLHEASERVFSAHMIQHELLMIVAAPLLIIGRPANVMLWSLPLGARKAVGRASRWPLVHALWTRLTRPLDAWLLHAVVIWCWHMPVLFQATLHNDFVHALQHFSFLGSGLLFWWTIIHPRRHFAQGMSILYLFTTAVHTGVLGALMTVSRTPWYPAYANSASAWGLSPLEDQQLAGMIMWIPASVVYLCAALIVLRRWLRASESSARRAEQSVGIASPLQPIS